MATRRLSPEERVSVALSMVDLVTRICAENELEKNPSITDEALIARLRKRFQHQKIQVGEG